MVIRVGDRAVRKFVIDGATMHWFREVAEDTSRIHCDPAYARARGYADVISYGGILLAHLLHLLGMNLPGPSGTSIAWSIKFHEPLYIDEGAEIALEVASVSRATGMVEGRFRIMAGARKIASGTTQSLVPLEEIGT